MTKETINYIEILLNSEYAALKYKYRVVRMGSFGTDVSNNINGNSFSFFPMVAAFSPHDFSNPMSLHDFLQNMHVPDFNQLGIPIVKEVHPMAKTLKFEKVLNDAFSYDNPPTDWSSVEFITRETTFAFLGYGVLQGMRLKNPVTAPIDLGKSIVKYVSQPEDNFIETATRFSQTLATGVFSIFVVAKFGDTGVSIVVTGLDQYNKNLNEGMELWQSKIDEKLLNASKSTETSNVTLITNTGSFFSKVFGKIGSISSNVTQVIGTSIKTKFKNFVELMDFRNIDTDLNGNQTISFEEMSRIQNISLVALNGYLWNDYFWDNYNSNNSLIAKMQNDGFAHVMESNITGEFETLKNCLDANVSMAQVLAVNDFLNMVMMQANLNGTFQNPINISENNLTINHNPLLSGLDSNINGSSIDLTLDCDMLDAFDDSDGLDISNFE